LVRDEEIVYEQQVIQPSKPCHCECGWILASNYYSLCQERGGSGRIVQDPNAVLG